MATNDKHDVFELSYPLEGQRSPTSDGENDVVKFGTNQDEFDMHRLGKKQQLNRNFKNLGILGLTCVVMGTWLGMLTASTFSLINGGRAGTIWVYVATWSCSMAVVASMAEMASMAPSSGGQYHWVSEFAPPNMQKLLSYLSGWLSALGWQAFIAVSAFQSAALILVIASEGSPSYVPQPWNDTLLTMGIAAFAVIFNVFFARRLPLFEGVVLFFHVLGFFAILVPLWVLAPKARASEVFGDFENFGGWSSVGAACIIGQLASAGAFIGADSAAHMAEEVKNASLTVPRMMMGTVILNGILGLVMTISYVFVIQNVQTQVVDSTAVFAFVDVFRVAVGSTAGAIGMTVPMIILSTSMCLNAVAAASRQAWSFARDDGLPFKSFFCKITTVSKTPLPINAMIASLFICMVLALLNLGGSAAFNSIMGLVTGAVGMTYALSIGCVLWRRLFGAPLPPARWSLGRFGTAINAFAVLYEIFTTCISFFPLMSNVTAKTMNWGVAMFGGVAIICLINYAVHGRKTYKGPVVYINRN